MTIAGPWAPSLCGSFAHSRSSRFFEQALVTEPSADGPHDPDGTLAIAAGIDEAVRLLNYATMSKAGLRDPADAYSVLGQLAAAMHKLPQALGQITSWMDDQVADGHARENPAYGPHGGDAHAAATAMTTALRAAATVATTLGGCSARPSRPCAAWSPPATTSRRASEGARAADLERHHRPGHGRAGHLAQRAG